MMSLSGLFFAQRMCSPKKGDVKGDGWRLIGLGPNQYYPALTSPLAGFLSLY